MTTPLLLSIFPTFAVGGAQMRFTKLVNHLGPAWRHAIVAMDGVDAARAGLSPTLDVSFPAIDNRKGDLLGNVRRFRAGLRALRPTTVLTHNFGSIEWAMANRIPMIRHVHVEDGFGPEERELQLGRRVWLRRVLLRGRTVVLPSQNLLHIARDRWRLPPASLRYVPNGVDTARFGERRPSRGERLVIGTVAALRPEKNIARLVRAFRIVADRQAAELVIVGDGPERQDLAALADRLGLSNRVRFLGHLADPAPALRSFDIFALSSDTEQMPISLLEAMSAGCATAATDVGDIAAMLPAAGRPFVTPRDDDALGAALLTLASEPGTRLALGQANRARACADFDQATMFATWSALLGGRSA